MTDPTPAADPRLAELAEALERVRGSSNLLREYDPPFGEVVDMTPLAAAILALLPARTATTEARCDCHPLGPHDCGKDWPVATTEAEALAARYEKALIAIGETSLSVSGECVFCHRLSYQHRHEDTCPWGIAAAALAATGGEEG